MFQQNLPFQQGQIIPAPSLKHPKREFKITSQINKFNQSIIYQVIPSNWSIKNEVALQAFPFHLNNTQNLKNIYQQIKDYQKKQNLQASDCNPSGIIIIYDQFEFQHQLIIVMELGQADLVTHLQKNQLDIQQKQSICLQVLQSIQFLHEQNWIQQDVQPKIFTMVGQEVKLLHLKLCESKNPVLFAPLFFNQNYQALELCEIQSYHSQASNIWAVGVIFYEIISGEQLFSFKSGLDKEQIKLQLFNQQEIQRKINQLEISYEWKQTIFQMFNPNQLLRITAQPAFQKLSQNNIAQICKIKQIQPNFSHFANINLQINQITQLLEQQLIVPQTQLSTVALKQLKQTVKRLLYKLNNQEVNPFSQIQKKLPTEISNLLKVFKNKIKEIEQSYNYEDEQIQELKRVQAKLKEYQDQIQNSSNIKTQIKQCNEKIIQAKQMQKDVKECQALERKLKEFNYDKLQNECRDCQEKILSLEKEIESAKFMHQKKIKLEKEYEDKRIKFQELNKEDLNTQFLKLKGEVINLELQIEMKQELANEISSLKSQINSKKVQLESNEQYSQKLREKKSLEKQIQDLQEDQEKVTLQENLNKIYTSEH
ncbi:unnamed protein product [Paramecium sonneborni]|uniref:Protein kinase domain-containing protein n=1 Tax=Paramecium sonneborni TaxID=65129 RepID=A0A8S1NXJ9_9CILI|nr:unnamed protein product [Paramecium sonneborni]